MSCHSWSSDDVFEGCETIQTVTWVARDWPWRWQILLVQAVCFLIHWRVNDLCWKLPLPLRCSAIFLCLSQFEGLYPLKHKPRLTSLPANCFHYHYGHSNLKLTKNPCKDYNKTYIHIIIDSLWTGWFMDPSR